MSGKCNMKRIRWVIIPILFILILACSMLPLAFTGPVQAGEGKSNLAELTSGADSVIVGTVVERSSYWNDEHTGIYTSAVLSIEEELKGTVGRDRITVTLPGGEADGIGQWVSDVPSFDRGEKAVVFLKKLSTEQLPKTKAYKAQLPEEQFEVYRGYQGKFAIKQGKVGSLPESKFKERVRKVTQGQILPEGELYVPLSTATFPYSYSGYCWPHPPDPVVGYRINENTADCSGEGAAVQTAAATWNGAGTRFAFSYAGASAATAYSYNGSNEILWKGLGSGGTIARAIIWYSGSTILENDIEFNDYYIWSAAASCPGGQFDVETIALHELGHWLCLNDLYDAADAAKVMYGYGSTGTTKRALHADDIAGIQYIYGASTTAPTVTNSTGASNITSTSARLNGELTSTGGATTTVHICWGDNDGGTGTWDHDENLGVKSTGAFYFDASGLTNGTTYYYRCYATNAAGSDWAVSTSSFVAQDKLIGADDGTPSAYSGGNYALIERFQAIESGTMTEFKIRVAASQSLKLSVYSDSAGSPATLLGSVTDSVVGAGFHTIGGFSIPIVKDTYYWLGVNSSNNSGVGYFLSGGVRKYKPASYGAWTWPNPWSGGFTDDQIHMIAAGWGSTAPPSAPTVTNSSGASSITSTSARLNGEITGTGGQNPTVTVYWGDNDGGTTPSSWDYNVNLGAKSAGTFYTDIINLNPNTTYYYRCYAANSSDSDWADSTKTFSTLAPPEKLIGADDTTCDGSSGANHVCLYRFQAEGGGDIVIFKLKASGSGNVKVAIYADDSGKPGALLTAVDSGTAVSAGWNDISIPSTTVVAGNYYWLAFNPDSWIVCYDVHSSTECRYRAASYSSFTFPDPATAGGSLIPSTAVTCLLAGWGVSAPPVAPTVTNSTGETNVTSTSARLNGEVTSTGGENPTVHIYWGDNDAGTGTWDHDVNLGTRGTESFYTDITGLTPSTDYYYRCYASNSSDSDWADSTETFNTLAAGAAEKLIGADDTTCDGSSGANHVCLYRFQAEGSSDTVIFKLKASGSGNVKVAIYADDSGKPGALLTAVDSGTAVSAGWNDISIPSTTVVAGNYYWLAFNPDSWIVCYDVHSSTECRYRAASYSSFTFPDPATAGGSLIPSTAVTCLLAGWGTPPAPPDAPTLLSPGTTITFKWNASSGATNYHLQVNTQSYFLGTNMFNAEIGDVTAYEVTGLSNGTTYHWRVRAGNNAGWSDWSSPTRSVLAN